MKLPTVSSSNPLEADDPSLHQSSAALTSHTKESSANFLSKTFVFERPRIYQNLRIDLSFLIDILLMMISGTAASIQGTATSKLSKTTASGFPPMFNFGVSTVLIFLVFLVTSQCGRKFNIIKGVRSVPWWMRFGGLFGAFYMVTITLMVPRHGLMFVYSVVMCTNVVVSFVVDTFGLFGVEKRPATILRIAGIVFIITGVIIATID